MLKRSSSHLNSSNFVFFATIDLFEKRRFSRRSRRASSWRWRWRGASGGSWRTFLSGWMRHRFLNHITNKGSSKRWKWPPLRAEMVGFGILAGGMAWICWSRGKRSDTSWQTKGTKPNCRNMVDHRHRNFCVACMRSGRRQVCISVHHMYKPKTQTK